MNLEHFQNKIIIRLLQWCCPAHLYESIEGDLLEEYEENVIKFGKKKAERMLIGSSLRFIRPGIVFRNRLRKLNHVIMLKSNLLIAFRQLMRNKLFSAINISGLSIGIVAFVLILQYVNFERSYEDFHKNAKQIFRITIDFYNDSQLVVSDCEMFAPIGPMLKEKYPEVKDYVRLYDYGRREVRLKGNTFLENKVYFADPSALSVFSFNLIHGNNASALTEPFQVVVTESLAKKYFNRSEVTGEIIDISNRPYKITGVIADLPPNTHLKIDLLLSHSTISKLWSYDETDFCCNNEFTYMLMDQQAEVGTFNQKLKSLSIDLKNKIGDGDEQLVADVMKDIHLYSHRSYEPEPNGNSRSVQFMYGVAFLILFIAWINYINLSTAKAMERAREVGVRKVMGSYRGQLIVQFLSESFIISMLATILSLGIIYLLWPSFIRLTGVPLAGQQLFTLSFWKVIALITVVGALVAGIYPAFVLSAFKPVQVLKGKFQSTMHGQWLRKGLVVFQFASAVLLIITLSTVFLQMNHLKKQDLGMNIEQVLALRTPSLYYDSIYLPKTDLFKNDLTQQSAVLKMGKSGGALPGMDMQELSSTSSFYRAGDTKKTGFVYYITSFDEDLAEALDFKFAAGRNFKKEEKGLILNEEAARLLGFDTAEQAIGSNVVLFDEQQTVIGVLNNFHQRSPKEAHIPMVFRYSAYADYFAIRFKPDEVETIMEVAKKSWDKAYPGSPFEYVFLDERFNEQYKSDQQFEKVIGLFSVLAAFIACLGLFGLSLFTILQRMKEIGIRKVLGASVIQVVGLLSRDFITLVMIASLVAMPVAYLLMQDWLSGFATHISLTAWMFIVPAALVLIVSFITVSFQTIRAAQSNPANTLKNE